MYRVIIPTILSEYGIRIRSFRPNARLYLINIIITGAALGIFRLLFNFYVLSLGYDEALLGKLVTINNFTGLLVALPGGYLADQMGRKFTLVLAEIFNAIAILAMVLMPEVSVLVAANILFGIGQSLAAVTLGPFLMENSGEFERTYLFSFSSGLQMASASAGNWIGGYLPTWVANWNDTLPTSSTAYSGALMATAFAMGFAIIPLLFLRRLNLNRDEKSVFAPLAYAAKEPALLGKLILPNLLIALGAGLIMPFMNVFFREVHHQSDPVIGGMFAWGSLAMGIGLLIAPPLADRMGKIKMVVITQALSIPFLIMLGFSPWFYISAAAYYFRLTLMNMSTPVYQTFVMEKVEASARATVASLISMSWNFGWAFSPMISGWFQVRQGFGPPFLGTIILYSISIVLYRVFFIQSDKEESLAPIPGD